MWKDFLYYTKTERQGIIVLVVLILGVYAAPKLFSFFTHAEDTDCRENEKFDKEYNDFISSLRETKPHQKSGHSFQSSPQREIKLAMFDLNSADTTELKKIPGIGSSIARMIVNYRERLGGFFRIEQLQEIHLKAEKLRPWFSIDTHQTRRINVNKAGMERMMHHPYINYYQAKVIIEYRKKKGFLKSLKQLSLYEEFTPIDLERLEPYICYN